MAASRPKTNNFVLGLADPIPTFSELSIVIAIASALSSRMGRVEKTQAMQMMKKALATRPSTQQVDFRDRIS